MSRLVHAGHGGQQQRRIGHRARHRPAVSWLCAMGMMPLRLTQPDRGLDAHEAADRRRAHDRAVGLGADRDGAQVRRRSPRAEPELEPLVLRSSAYGIARLPAARAPARGRPRAAEVGPLGEVGLAEDHAARGAQPRRRRRRRVCAMWLGQRQRARAGVHAIGRVDVVLEQHRARRAAVRARPSRDARGRALRAMASASGLRSITALIAGPARSIASMRARYACAIDTDVRCARAHRCLQVGDGGFGELEGHVVGGRRRLRVSPHGKESGCCRGELEERAALGAHCVIRHGCASSRPRR